MPKKIFLGHDNTLEFLTHDREVVATLDGNTGNFDLTGMFNGVLNEPITPSDGTLNITGDLEADGQLFINAIAPTSSGDGNLKIWSKNNDKLILNIAKDSEQTYSGVGYISELEFYYDTTNADPSGRMLFDVGFGRFIADSVNPAQNEEAQLIAQAGYQAHLQYNTSATFLSMVRADPLGITGVVNENGWGSQFNLHQGTAEWFVRNNAGDDKAGISLNAATEIIGVHGDITVPSTAEWHLKTDNAAVRLDLDGQTAFPFAGLFVGSTQFYANGSGVGSGTGFEMQFNAIDDTGDERLLYIHGNVQKATSGNYTGIYMDIAENVVNDQSYLLDLRTDGQRRFTVTAEGIISELSNIRVNPGTTFRIALESGQNLFTVDENGAAATVNSFQIGNIGGPISNVLKMWVLGAIGQTLPLARFSDSTGAIDYLKVETTGVSVINLQGPASASLDVYSQTGQDAFFTNFAGGGVWVVDNPSANLFKIDTDRYTFNINGQQTLDMTKPANDTFMTLAGFGAVQGTASNGLSLASSGSFVNYIDIYDDITGIEVHANKTSVTGSTDAFSGYVFSVYNNDVGLIASFANGTAKGSVTINGDGGLGTNGDIYLFLAGGGLHIKEGTDATMGVATLVGGTVTIATTKVTAISRIFLTGQADGGTPGFLRVSSRNVGTDFTITSSSGTDTSDVAWVIIEPTA